MNPSFSLPDWKAARTKIPSKDMWTCSTKSLKLYFLWNCMNALFFNLVSCYTKSLSVRWWCKHYLYAHLQWYWNLFMRLSKQEWEAIMLTLHLETFACWVQIAQPHKTTNFLRQTGISSVKTNQLYFSSSFSKENETDHVVY